MFVKKTGFAVLAVSMALGLAGVTAGQAQQVSCSCTTPLGAAPGNPLFLGSQVVAGADSSSTLTVGRCTMSVPANATLVISRTGQNICLRVARINSAPADTAASGGAFGGNTMPLVIGGAVIVGGGVIAIAVSGNSASN